MIKTDPIASPRLQPVMSYPSLGVRDEVVAVIAQSLRIVEDAGGFMIEEAGYFGDAPRRWPGAFASRAGAELFRRDLILAAADGVDNEACGPGSPFALYDMAAACLGLIERHDGNDRSLAMSVAKLALESRQTIARPDTSGEGG